MCDHNRGPVIVGAKVRSDYWHFEQSHKILVERGTDCRECNAELAPHREDNHRMNPQVLTASCVRCHVAQE